MITRKELDEFDKDSVINICVTQYQLIAKQNELVEALEFKNLVLSQYVHELKQLLGGLND